MTDRLDVMIASQIVRIGGMIAIVARVLSAQPPPPSTCWTPHPADRCTGWFVNELGLESAFSSTIGSAQSAYSKAIPDFATRVVFTLGGMKNTKSDVATGFSVSVGSNEPDQYYRAELRRRHWLAEDQSIEYSAGLTTMNVYGFGRRRSPRANGATAGVSVGLGPIGLDARADLLWGMGRPVAGLSAGAKAGSKAMPLATLVLGLFALLALASS